MRPENPFVDDIAKYTEGHDLKDDTEQQKIVMTIYTAGISTGIRTLIEKIRDEDLIEDKGELAGVASLAMLMAAYAADASPQFPRELVDNMIGLAEQAYEKTGHSLSDIVKMSEGMKGILKQARDSLGSVDDPSTPS